jgi:hypothetical protein
VSDRRKHDIIASKSNGISQRPDRYAKVFFADIDHAERILAKSNADLVAEIINT